MKKVVYLLLAIILSQSLKAQTDTLTRSNHHLLFRPTIGFGVGMLNYYGELSKNERANNPLVNNIGYEVNLGFPISESFDVFVRFFRGDLSANANLGNNLNFKSQITTAGINFMYNFAHTLEKDRFAEPYISLGFEALEFLSKTDLHDGEGNKYNYWSDGTIRNVPETPESNPNALRIQRNYEYETDLRSLDYEGAGLYDEYTFAVPVGAGVLLRLHPQVKFKFGASMHFTFTDRIDGISAAGKGLRNGDNSNDRFLFTSVGLMWNFSSQPKTPGRKSNLTKEDWLAIDKGDYDEDGVMDFKDKCPNTPRGKEVDKDGCATDGSDFAEFDEEEMQKKYESFIDTSAANQFLDTSYAKQSPIRTQRQRPSSSFTPSTSSPAISTNFKQPESPSTSNNDDSKSVGTPISEANGIYTVQLGAYKNVVTDNRFEGVKDLYYKREGDGLIRYFSGKFENRLDANKWRNELLEKGFKDAWIKQL